MQYCSLEHWTLLLSPVTSTNGYCYCFGSITSFFSGVISPLISCSILGTNEHGEFLFQYPIILPFHTVHGVLKAKILKWFSLPFSSEPHSGNHQMINTKITLTMFFEAKDGEALYSQQKQHPVVDVTGDRSKVQCSKEQYCIGTWNVRSMNQGKLEVVKQWQE